MNNLSLTSIRASEAIETLAPSFRALVRELVGDGLSGAEQVLEVGPTLWDNLVELALTGGLNPNGVVGGIELTAHCLRAVGSRAISRPKGW